MNRSSDLPLAAYISGVLIIFIVIAAFVISGCGASSNYSGSGSSTQSYTVASAANHVCTGHQGVRNIFGLYQSGTVWTSICIDGTAIDISNLINQ